MMTRMFRISSRFGGLLLASALLLGGLYSDATAQHVSLSHEAVPLAAPLAGAPLPDLPDWDSESSRPTTNLAWGDVDGDGDLDLAIGNGYDYDPQPNQLYLNDGAGNLSLGAWAPDSRSTYSVAWGDVDGDGDLDLAVGNAGQPNQL